MKCQKTLILDLYLDRNSYEMRQILHTRSNSVQNSSKKLKQHLEEETIEERNNSKSILQKNKKNQQHRFNRLPRSEALVHCPYHYSETMFVEAKHPEPPV